MTPELAFLIANTSVVPAWFLLVVLPNSALTQRVVHGFIFPFLLGGAYLVAIAMSTTTLVEGGSFFSLEGVMLLFTNPWGVVAGWIHYLAFDLFVGAWEARDARRRGVPRWLLTVCLLLTFMYGPIGLLLYGIARILRGTGGALSEDAVR
ncbi:MAG: hypothetical protein ACI81R_002736 [Bradymonadia bacterium]|jgi:hypothetical protein